MSGKTARVNQNDNIQYVKIIAALMEYKNSVRVFFISAKICKLQCFHDFQYTVIAKEVEELI
jgi:hypothetical protein